VYVGATPILGRHIPAPLISITGHADFADIPMPPPLEEVPRFMNQYPFERLVLPRKWKDGVDKLVWRGTLHSGLNSFPRQTILALGQSFPDLIDARYSHVAEEMTPEYTSTWFSFSFVKKNNWTDVEILLGKKTSRMEMEAQFIDFKYHIALDGQGAGPRFLAQLAGSSSLVFKPGSPFFDYYQPRLVPWVHYIPVNGDLSDIIEKNLWTRSNIDAVLKIIDNLKNFAHAYLRAEDMLCYSSYFLDSLGKLMAYNASDIPIFEQIDIHNMTGFSLPFPGNCNC
jgi:Glycosyl transferase family 90